MHLISVSYFHFLISLQNEKVATFFDILCHSMSKNCLPLFRVVVKFCSTDRLNAYFLVSFSNFALLLFIWEILKAKLYKPDCPYTQGSRHNFAVKDHLQPN